MVRLDIQVHLQSHEQDLPNFGLEPMTDDEKATVVTMVNVEEAVIREEMDIDTTELAANVEATSPLFTPDQQEIYDTVMRAVRQNDSLQLFISARGVVVRPFFLTLCWMLCAALSLGVVLLLVQQPQVLLPSSFTLARHFSLG